MVNRGKTDTTKIEDNTTLNGKPMKDRQYHDQKIEDNTTLNDPQNIAPKSND